MKHSKHLITIDPGWSGAVAFFDSTNLQFTTNCPTSREPEDMVKVIRNESGINLIITPNKFKKE